MIGEIKGDATWNRRVAIIAVEIPSLLKRWVEMRPTYSNSLNSKSFSPNSNSTNANPELEKSGLSFEFILDLTEIGLKAT